jgi:hypothetical protein
MSSTYDLIIVGAGVAGLRVGIEVLKRQPNLRCCILEKYGYVGGRVVTFRKDIPKVGKVQWENGAGRISFSHKKAIKLLSEYNLHLMPISPITYYINSFSPIPHVEENLFEKLIGFYLEPLSKLSKDTLQNHTLKEILEKTAGPANAKEFYVQFPYYAEIHTLRADIALEAFKKEMGSYENFGVCKEGLSSLTDAMSLEFISRGGKIMLDHEIKKIRSQSDRSLILDCQIRNTTRQLTFMGKAVVFALHSAAVKEIDGMKSLGVLRHLKMMPLLRIYAIFPTRKGVSWFSGLDKIVTNANVRYILPIDPKRGIIMISYTDGLDAQYWIKQDETAKEHGNENVKELVMTDIRKLFPDRIIPDPIFFKQHPWYEGCTYWLPGAYDVEEESKKSLHPLPVSMPNLFMCGESFAVKQCWIESALDQADKLLDNDKFRITLRNL